MDVRLTTFLSLLACVTLTACSTNPTDREPLTVAEPAAVQYQIRTGDTLAKIADNMTGDIENWRTIASFNNLDDPRRIQAGSVLLIPAELVEAGATMTALDMTAQDASAVPAAADPARKTWVAQTAPGNVSFQPTEVPGAIITPVSTLPIAVNRRFDVDNTASQPDTGTPAVNTDKLTHVRVVGSYYPKGIYAQPFNHSPLIMRANPGTVFKVDQILGEWLRIATDVGAGYIRARDATPVDAAEANLPEANT